MIFGHAKTILNEQGHSLQKALPTVVRAPNMRLNHAGAGPALLLPFTAKEGDFYMEIRMEKF
jgi:CheY-specific phosphatase CheX